MNKKLFGSKIFLFHCCIISTASFADWPQTKEKRKREIKRERERERERESEGNKEGERERERKTSRRQKTDGKFCGCYFYFEGMGCVNNWPICNSSPCVFVCLCVGLYVCLCVIGV